MLKVKRHTDLTRQEAKQEFTRFCEEREEVLAEFKEVFVHSDIQIVPQLKTSTMGWTVEADLYCGGKLADHFAPATNALDKLRFLMDRKKGQEYAIL